VAKLQRNDKVNSTPNFFELMSTFDGLNGSFGAIFDITAKELKNDDTALYIDSFDIHSK